MPAVRQLEWNPYAVGTENYWLVAYTPVGLFELIGSADYNIFISRFNNRSLTSSPKTLEEVKQVCQNHYQYLIESCLLDTV